MADEAFNKNFDKKADQEANKAKLAYELRKRQMGRQDKPKPAAPKFIAEHKVASGDTLSGLAAKYYNSAAREKWMAIYEANKDVIGDDPGMIRVGQVLKIPELKD
ncbi:MAG: hypothetical protein Kow0080_18440 [Candidatus Promineifilaceae bacterium]